MCNQYTAWRTASRRVIFVLSSILISTPASAVDLKLVTFLQDDLTEYMSGAALSLPAEPGSGETDLAGPIASYEYDDCYAQLGISDKSAAAEADLVLDYTALRANKAARGITVEGGITVWLGDQEYQAAKLTFLISDPDDRGAAIYLLNRLAGLCRAGR